MHIAFSVKLNFIVIGGIEMGKYYEILTLLSEIAGEYGENTYSVQTYALGYIPFKNSENKINDVGNKFIDVARWLLEESEKNFNESLIRKTASQ